MNANSDSSPESDIKAKIKSNSTSRPKRKLGRLKSCVERKAPVFPSGSSGTYSCTRTSYISSEGALTPEPIEEEYKNEYKVQSFPEIYPDQAENIYHTPKRNSAAMEIEITPPQRPIHPQHLIYIGDSTQITSTSDSPMKELQFESDGNSPKLLEPAQINTKLVAKRSVTPQVKRHSCGNVLLDTISPFSTVKPTIPKQRQKTRKESQKFHHPTHLKDSDIQAVMTKLSEVNMDEMVMDLLKESQKEPQAGASIPDHPINELKAPNPLGQAAGRLTTELSALFKGGNFGGGGEDSFDLEEMETGIGIGEFDHSMFEQENPKLEEKKDIYIVDKRAYTDHLVQTIQSISLVKTLSPVPPALIKNKTLTLQRPHNYIGTVVFDLDETLVHCNENPSDGDVQICVSLPSGDKVEAGVNIRPYCLKCLREVRKMGYEVIVFTASHRCYADEILNYLDPENELIHHRLYRENCIQTAAGLYIKDLRVIDRPLSQTVIIDNATYSFAFQLDNGIPIIPFYSDTHDRALAKILSYIHTLHTAEDQDYPKHNRNQFQLYKLIDSNVANFINYYLDDEEDEDSVEDMGEGSPDGLSDLFAPIRSTKSSLAFGEFCKINEITESEEEEEHRSSVLKSLTMFTQGLQLERSQSVYKTSTSTMDEEPTKLFQ